MKKLLCARISLLTALRRLRSNIGSWISLLLIPALMTGCILLFSKEESSPSAGFALDTSSPSEQALAFSRLLEEDGFLLMEKEELRESVSTGRLDCGFLFPASFPEAGATPAPEGSIRLLCSQRTVLDAFFREKLAARLLSLSAPSLAAGIAGYYGFPGGEEELQDRFSAWYEDGELYSFTFESVEGTPAPEEGILLSSLLSGIVALFPFSALLLSAGSLSPRKNRGLLQALGGGSFFRLLVFPLGLLQFCLVFLFTVGSLLLISAFFPGTIPSFIWYALPWYLLSLSGVEALASAFLPSAGAFLLPAVFSVSLILCPIFLDITVFLPLLEPLRWLLPPCWLYLPSDTPGASTWLWPLLSLLIFSIGFLSLRFQCSSARIQADSKA